MSGKINPMSDGFNIVPGVRHELPAIEHAVPADEYGLPDSFNLVPAYGDKLPNSEHSVPTGEYVLPDIFHGLSRCRLAMPRHIATHGLPPCGHCVPGGFDDLPGCQHPMPGKHHRVSNN